MLSILIQSPDDLYNIFLFRRYTRTRRERWVIGPAGRSMLTVEETEAVEVRPARPNWWAMRPVAALTPQPEVLPYLEVAYSEESDDEVEYLGVRRVGPAPSARPPRPHQESAPASQRHAVVDPPLRPSRPPAPLSAFSGNMGWSHWGRRTDLGSECLNSTPGAWATPRNPSSLPGMLQVPTGEVIPIMGESPRQYRTPAVAGMYVPRPGASRVVVPRFTLGSSSLEGLRNHHERGGSHFVSVRNPFL